MRDRPPAWSCRKTIGLGPPGELPERRGPEGVTACLATAVVMHFIAPRVESRYRTLLWFDAFGLALVTVAGTVKAADAGVPAVVAVAMGAAAGVPRLDAARALRNG